MDEASRACEAGGLAGSGSASPEGARSGSPRQGDPTALASRTPAPDEPPPPGWFFELCELIASKMPRRVGRHGIHLSALTPDVESRISRVIIAGGGWRRFDAQVRPLLVEFDKEIRSPHRLLETLYRQVDAGAAHRRPPRSAGRLPPFVGEGYVERFSGDERAATLECATALAATSNPEVPHYERACAWLAARAAERDVAEFITEHSWVFLPHHRDALVAARRALEAA